MSCLECCWVRIAGLGLVLTACGVAAGDDAGENHPSGVEADIVKDVDEFHVQGEYASGIFQDAIVGRGTRNTAVSNGPPWGLQVVALGEKQFRATLLRGGLPGNGWDRAERISLDGTVDGNRVEFRGDDYRVVLHDTQAHVSHAGYGEVAILVKVQRRSPHAGLAPPFGAIVLFDGHHAKALKNPRLQDGLLQVGTELIPTFRNYQMHVEFLVPYMPKQRGQGRANSGIYLQSRYEVQILDSFGLEGRFNECGALYRQRSPDVNMTFPPVTWQTYDITFHAPIFNACGVKRCDARLTVLHNGVPVHDDVQIVTKTGAGKPEGPSPRPIKLQDHGNPVQFRNVWLLELL